MTVQCPRCATQYRVPESRLTDARPVFKCTRCDHVFSPGADRPGPRAATRSRGEDKNLSFSFDEPRRSRGPSIAQTPEPEADGDDDEQELDAPDAALEDDGQGRMGQRRASEPAFVGDLSPAEPAGRTRDRARRATPRPAPARTGRASALERTLDADVSPPPEIDTDDEEDDEQDQAGPLLISESERPRRAAINPRRRTAAATRTAHASPLKPVAIGVGAVVFAFLVLAVALDRQPELAFRELARVPLLGRLLGDDHLLVWRLQINDVTGSVDRIRGERPAYVVSGQVQNTTGQNLRLIEIEGRLLADGVERRRQVVYAANQFRKTIRDLSASEVEMLLRLEPNRRFVIRPGESASFLLVFPDPPPNTTEVTCRVVDARPA